MRNEIAMHGVFFSVHPDMALRWCRGFFNTGGKTMEWNSIFFINSILLGAGLAMDAFSVSLANGLNEPAMRRRRMCLIAGVFAGFQAAMPLLGWLCVHTIVQYFSAVQGFIPWIALILLLFIGGKMLIEGIRGNEEESEQSGTLGIGALMIQGIATSIDALSVGFTISDYGFIMAFVCALLIAAVTFVICMGGLAIGKKFGTKLSGKASILGGAILIFIGIEIFVTGVIL
jgi:putative Mn2+ efflux pump MntP